MLQSQATPAGRGPPYRGRDPPTADGVADVGVVGPLVEVAHAGVGIGVGAVDGLRLAPFVGAPDVADGQQGVGKAFGILQGQALARGETLGERVGHVEGDGDRPEQARFQAHGIEDGVVVGTAEESSQQGETAV